MHYCAMMMEKCKGEDVQLNIGDQLLVQFGTFGDRLVSIVVDLDPGRHISIFLKMPPQLFDRIAKIRAVSAQFVQESTLMGFNTTITTYCSSPVCVLQLAYPACIEAQDARKEKRLDCNFPATLSVEGLPFRCMVENISASGVRVRILQQTDMHVLGIFDDCADMVLDFFVLEERNRYTFSCTLLREFIQNRERYAVLLIAEEEEDIRRLLDGYVQSVFGALEAAQDKAQ